MLTNTLYGAASPSKSTLKFSILYSLSKPIVNDGFSSSASGVHVVFASLSVTFSPSLDDETVTGWLYAKSISMFCPFSVRTILFSSSGLITSSPKTFTSLIAGQTATLDSLWSGNCVNVTRTYWYLLFAYSAAILPYCSFEKSVLAVLSHNISQLLLSFEPSTLYCHAWP